MYKYHLFYEKATYNLVSRNRKTVEKRTGDLPPQRLNIGGEELLDKITKG
jgi:hypothetical protein